MSLVQPWIGSLPPRLAGLRWLISGRAAVVACFCSLAACATAAEPGKGEQMVFYPSLGWKTGQGWVAEIHGCVFDPESRRLTVPWLQHALGIEDEELSAAERQRFRERARLLLVDHQDDRMVSIRFQGQTCRVGPSADNGRFLSRLPVSGDSAAAGRVLHFEVLRRRPPAAAVAGRVFLVGETGWSVVSDIDDTIKVTQVGDRREMVRNTFCRPFQPVPGMSTLYREWARAGAAFHYVSAGPWQLYPPLGAFVREQGFPGGSFHMRNLRIKDASFLGLLQSPEPYKLEAIGALLERFPRRRFVLVGDSGERDPEIYGALARRHPEQVARILIRNVTGEAPAGSRFQQAFAGLPAALWQVFERPAEVSSRLLGANAGRGSQP